MKTAVLKSLSQSRTRHKWPRVLLVSALTLNLLSQPLPTLAAVPAIFNYQGKLSDATGNPITNTAPGIAMAFRVYDDLGALQTTYTPATPVPVTNGVFNVLIGDMVTGSIIGSSLDLALGGVGDRFLEVVVNGVAMAPKQRLVAVPYAMSVADGSVGTPQLADGAVTGVKILNGSITDAHITDVSWGKLTGIPGGIGATTVRNNGVFVVSASTMNYLTPLTVTTVAGAAQIGVNGSSVTLQGNTFNLPNTLLQLNAGGVVPVNLGGTGQTSTTTARVGLEAVWNGVKVNPGTGLAGGGPLTGNVLLGLDMTGLPGSCDSNSLTAKVYWDGSKFVCGTDNSGAAGTVTGAGTLNTLSKWSSTGSTLANSSISDTGSLVTVGTGMNVTGLLSATNFSGNGAALTNVDAVSLVGEPGTAFAPMSHVHSAADITSGVLVAARGGTGIGSYTPGNFLSAQNATTLQERTPAQVRGDITGAKSGVNNDITQLSGLTTAITLAQGGTGGTDAVTARASLSAAKSGANSDITSLSGLTTPLTVAQGGTGGNSQATAQTALGLGSLATKSSVGNGDWSGGPLSLANGGTNAVDGPTALVSLGAAARGTNSDITNLTALAQDLNMNNHKVTGLATPAAGTDAATKSYVDLAVGGAGGGLTSVGLTMPASEFTVTGSPLTANGTLVVSKVVQAANTVYAGPSSAGPTAPTFRALVAADMPLVDVAHGGTGGTTVAGARTGIGLGISADCTGAGAKLLWTAAGGLTCGADAGSGGGALSGGGTGGTVALWSGSGGSSVLADSIMTQVATTLSVAGNLGVTGSVGSGGGTWAGTPIGSAGIAAGAIISGKIGASAVGTTEIADGSIAGVDLAAGSVTSGKIGSGAVGSTEILDGSIASADLAAGSVISGKIGTLAVGTAELANASVTAAKLAAGAVSAGSIAPSATAGDMLMTSVGLATTWTPMSGDAKITGAGAVTIQPGVVTAGKLADGIVTGGTAGAGVKIAAATITGANLANGAVTAGKIGAGVVGVTELADGSVTGGTAGAGVKIAAGTITGANLAALAVTAGKYGTGSIVNADVSGTAAIAYSKLSLGSSIVTGDITDGTIKDADVSATAAIAASKISGLGSLATASAVAVGVPPTGQIQFASPGDGNKLLMVNPNLGGPGVLGTAWTAMSGDATMTGAGALTIANGAVTSAKILDGTVTGTDIAATTITGANLANATITAGKYGAGSIVNADVSAAAAIAYSKLSLTGSIVTGDITDGTIATADLAAGAVTGAKIADGSITGGTAGAGVKIAATTITGANLAAGAVTAGKYGAGSLVNADVSGTAAIAYSKLNLASSIVTGDITDGTIVNADINAAAAIAPTKIAGTAATGTGTLRQIPMWNNTAGQLADSVVNQSSAGNIGIGISAPSTAKLVVKTATTGQEGLDLSSADSYANLRVIHNSLNPSDKDMYIGYQSGATSSLHLYSNNTETMTLKGAAVAIGTNDPGVDQLRVLDSNPNAPHAIEAISNADGSFINNIAVYAIAGGTGNGTNYAVFASASGATGNYAGYFQGNVVVAGDFTVQGDCYSPNNPGSYQAGQGCHGLTFDLAELITVRPGEVYSAGDVIAVSNDKEIYAGKSDGPYSTKVLGVASTAPAMIFEDNKMVSQTGVYVYKNDGKIPLAIAGRVPTKVTDENGPIMKGDLLTSAGIAAHGMKFTLLEPNDAKDFNELKKIMSENEQRRNAVFGRALEDFSADKLDAKTDASGQAAKKGIKTGKIMVMMGK